jgi:hypothetical protein
VLYLSAIDILEDPVSHYTEIDFAADSLRTQEEVIRIITIMCSTVLLTLMQRMAYKRLLNEQYQVTIIDGLSVVVVILMIGIAITTRRDVYEVMEYETLQNYQEYSYAVVMFSISLRIASILTQTRTFGPWIRMIFIITKSTLTFLVLFVLVVLSFATGFVFLFRKDGEYFGSIQLSIRTLFQWSVGGIDTSIFTHREELGSILAIVWAFASTIILLNLLIAVLSARYEDLAPKITADYVSIMYQAYSQTRYTEPYGALIIAPAPFNFLTFPLLPLYLLFPKVAPKLDKWFVLGSYQVLFLAAVCLFACYAILISLFVYFHVCYDLISKRRYLKLPIWLLLSPFYLVYLALISSKRFMWEMYRTPPSDCGIEIPSHVLTPAKICLETLCANTNSPIRLQLSDIETLVATLPYSTSGNREKTSTIRTIKTSKDEEKFRKLAQRIYFSRSQLLNDKKRAIISLFAQFQSLPLSSLHPSIHLPRMLRLLHLSSPAKLPSIHLLSTQTALSRLQADLLSQSE